MRRFLRVELRYQEIFKVSNQRNQSKKTLNEVTRNHLKSDFWYVTRESLETQMHEDFFSALI